MRAEVKRMLAEGNTFWTDQFNNQDAITGYMGIGRELVEQTGGRLDVFCGAVGTAGMLTGVSKALKEGGCAARIVALEPASAPLLTQGHGGPHRVEGIAPGFVPPHLTPGVYDEARAVDEGEARVLAKRLAKEEGIFAGTSTALNVAAALKLAKELGPGKVVATVAVDTGLKYLAGDLFT
jgi:cysteine synthase A